MLTTLIIVHLNNCILSRFDQIAVVRCAIILSYRLRIIHPVIHLLSLVYSVDAVNMWITTITHR